MSKVQKPYQMINDYVTGTSLPNVGSEENRQAVERYLVENRKYLKSDIHVNFPINLTIAGSSYQSTIDLIVEVDGVQFMAIKCAPGSLNSWERQILTAARLVGDYQIPFSVVSDGQTAVLLDTLTGNEIDQGLDAIPSREKAIQMIPGIRPEPLPEKRLEREKLIFRTYDSMNINVGRNITQ